MELGSGKSGSVEGEKEENVQMGDEGAMQVWVHFLLVKLLKT